MRRLYFVAGMLAGLAILMLGSIALLAQPAGAGLPSSIPLAPPQTLPEHAAVDVCTYSVSSSTGSTIVPGTTDTGNSCDDCTTAIVLPFGYQLYDQTFTTANLSSNGNVQFVSNSARSANTCLPALDFDYTIFAQWGDLVTNCFECGIFTSVSGTAPNRIFNIEWRAMFFEGLPVNFELRLYEGLPQFDIIYGSIPTNGASATVGVQKSQVRGPITQYECNTVGTLSDGLQLTFAPADCPTPTSTPAVTPTRTPLPPPCSVCPVITSVDISCNTDGTIAWTATIHNSGTCDITSNWKARLQKHKIGHNDFSSDTSSRGRFIFPPGDTTLSGNFCFNAPAGIDLIRVVFSLGSDDDCEPLMKSESIPPCPHTGNCPRSPQEAPEE